MLRCRTAGSPAINQYGNWQGIGGLHRVDFAALRLY
jgi:hypothetical protein